MKMPGNRDLLRLWCLSAFLCAGQSLAYGGLFVRFSEFPAGISAISGESTAPGRNGWADLGSFQGGAALPVTLVIGSQETGKPQITAATLSKNFDGLSTALVSALTLGKTFGKVEIETEVFDGSNMVSPLSITLNNVLLESFYWTAIPGSPDLEESISLVFESATYRILKRNPDESYTPGTGYVAYYNLITNSGTYGSIGEASPAITSVPAQDVVRNTQGNSFAFSFYDPDTTLTEITADAFSLSEDLIPDASIVVEGSGGTRTVTFSTADATGPATIRLSVSDGVRTSTLDVTVYVVNGAATPTLQGPTVLLSCIEGLSPFRELLIAEPDTGSSLKLVLMVENGELNIRDDVPGGVLPDEISGNGTRSITIFSNMIRINATLADSFGLLHSTLTNSDTDLTLILNNTDPSSTLLDARVIPVVVYGNLYSRLQADYFTEEEIALNLETGELDDYDGDGTLNLIEIGTGLDPTNPSDLVPLAIDILNEAGDRFLQVTYRRRLATPTFLYAIEVYDTLTSTWLDGTALVTQLGAPERLNPQLESVTFRISDALIGPATLVRLKVLKLP